MSNTSRNLVLAALAALVAALLGEVLLRALGTPPRIHSGWLWEQSPRRAIARFADDVPNQIGCRGQAIEYGGGDFVVVLLGDSQVEAARSSPGNMPERFLEASLRARLGRPVKVFSLGVSGWSQDQQLLALERYLGRFRADLMLVWATPGNDFFENAFPDRGTSAIAGPVKPTFRWRDGGGLKGPYFEHDFLYRNSAILQLLAMARLEGKPLEQRVLDDWLVTLPAPYVLGATPDGPCSTLTEVHQKDFYKSTFTQPPDRHFRLMTHEDYLTSRSHFSPNMVHRSPRDDYLVQLTRALYERLKCTAERVRAAFYVFYAVREDLDGRSLLIDCLQKPGKPRTAMPVRIDYPARLREVVPLGHLVMVDLPGGAALSVASDDGHLSDAGNREAMDMLAAAVADRQAAPGGTSTGR